MSTRYKKFAIELAKKSGKITRKNLYVAGTFDNKGGKPSKIAQEIFEQVRGKEKFDYINGGSFLKLKDILKNIKKYKLVYWFANVSNNEEKIVKEIKHKNQALILVTSKRNENDKYNLEDIIYHALDIKSNLVVEFSKKKDRYYGRVLDPLANIFLDCTTEFKLVGRVLRQRVKELLKHSRASSKCIGKIRSVPEEKDFFNIVKNHGKLIHDLVHVHPRATNRFLGNASFRCEKGFPSFKFKDNLIFVSKRNIDKRTISKDSFVGVKTSLPIEYFGENKPSVDTPIQILLYKYYKNIKYILHSHTYVKGAVFTKNIIPCGALEEAKEITSTFPDKNLSNFSINLIGHGSLTLVDDINYFKKIIFVSRNLPEVHSNYLK